MSLRTLSLGLVVLAAAASAQQLSDMTEDGLVRVPSSRKAGVYRLPDATFAQYRRIMLEPASVAFRKNWDRKGLDRLDTGLKPSERQRIANDLVLAFRDEMVAELVQRGGFVLTETPAPDVFVPASGAST